MMLAVTGFILKLIGLLLLGILGLVLLILFLILFVPVCYRAEGSFSGNLKGKAQVSWLFHILSLRVEYDGEPDVGIRVFGIRIGRRDRGGQDADGRPDTGCRPDTGDGQDTDVRQGTGGRPDTGCRPDTGDGQDTDARQGTGGRPDTGCRQNTGDGRQDTGDGQDTGAGRDTGNPENGSRKAGRKREQTPEKKPDSAEPEKKWKRKWEKIRVTFRHFCDKLKSVRTQKDQILEFINREENRQTFRLLKRQIFRLLKHILPRKLRGTLRFGFDDPYTTGQILMWVSPFYGFYARHFQLIPVFEEPAFEGDLRLKGHVRVITLLVIAIRVWMDRNFRTLFRAWRNA